MVIQQSAEHRAGGLGQLMAEWDASFRQVKARLSLLINTSQGKRLLLEELEEKIGICIVRYWCVRTIDYALFHDLFLHALVPVRIPDSTMTFLFEPPIAALAPPLPRADQSPWTARRIRRELVEADGTKGCGAL